jgi:hypothetical protein
MTIHYHLSENTDAEKPVEISGFLSFKDWLWGLGVGLREDAPEMLRWWSDAYRDLATGKISGCRFGRGRLPEVGRYVQIVKVE